jgi:signal transduction histidine kinase
MIPRTLRGKLVLAAAAAVVLAVFAFGMAAARFVEHELRVRTDASLRDRAGDVARLSAAAPALMNSAGTLDAAVGGRQIDVEIIDRRGRVVGRSLSLGARLLPRTQAVDDAIAHGRGGYSNVTIGGEPVRMYAAPLADSGGSAAGGAVLLASRVDDIDDVAHGIRAGLIVFGALAGVLGAAVAAGLVARGLTPLRRLSAGAKRIEATGDPGQRLPVPGNPKRPDEVRELATALNGMLAALQGARERERRLLADASHELRTPLTALAGNVDHLARHGADPELIDDLRHDTARLRRLVDDLLTLEREGAGGAPTEPVPLAELVQDAAAADPRVVARVDVPLTVTGDADALRRALGNLVENALVHGPPEGEIVVALRRDDAGRALVSVTDEGPGIPAAERESAFERFARGAGASGRPGAGLGLALVRATSRRHGGEAWADGSTVTMALPGATVDAHAEDAPAPA